MLCVCIRGHSLVGGKAFKGRVNIHDKYSIPSQHIISSQFKLLQFTREHRFPCSDRAFSAKYADSGAEITEHPPFCFVQKTRRGLVERAGVQTTGQFF